MLHFRLLVFMCLVFTTAVAEAAAATPEADAALAAPPTPQTSTTGFVYQPIGGVPQLSVAGSRFTEMLRTACERLDEGPDNKAPDLSQSNPCPQPQEAPAALPADLSSQLESLGSLACATNVEGQCLTESQCADAADDSAMIVGYLGRLQQTCRVLRARNRPRTLSIEPHLGVLRTARDNPDVLALVEKWAPDFAASELGNKAREAASRFQSASSGVPASLGALGDRLVRGTAEFLEKRAQEEALRYLRKRLTKELCGSEGGDSALRRSAFQNVCSTLATLDSGTSLQAIGNYLRAAAERDLRKLPDVVLAYLQYKNSDLEPWVLGGRLGMAYFAAVRSGRIPLDVLAAMGELTLNCRTQGCETLRAALQLSSAVAYALRQGGPDWSSFFSEVAARDRTVVGAAIALLAEKRVQDLEQRATPETCAMGAATPAQHAQQIFVNAEPLLTSAQVMANIGDQIQNALAGELPLDTRRLLLAEEFQHAVAAAAKMLELSVHTRGATESTEAAFRAIGGLPTFSSIMGSLAERQYGEGVVELVAALRDSGAAASLPAEWNRFLPLTVELATANSSSDVAAAFDAFAEPVGAYEMKFRRPVIAVNGFVGGLAGRERIASRGLKGTTGMVAAFAPVGVHVTTPFIESAWHMGLFLSALDVGAVTTIRTGDKQPTGMLEGVEAPTSPATVSDSAEIGLAQVFSPGVYVTMGLFDAPLVLGAGASLSPELRRVTQSSNGETLETNVSVLRYGLFLAIDVPMFIMN